MKYCPSCRKEYEDRPDFCCIDGTLLRKKSTAKEESKKEQIPRSKSPEVAERLFVTGNVAEPATNASKPFTKEIPLVQDPFAAIKIVNRNAEAITIEVGRHPSIRGRMVATTAVVAGVLFLFIIGLHIFKRSEPAKRQELASRQETVPLEQSPEAPALPSEPNFQSPSPSGELASEPSPALGSKSSPTEPQKPSGDANVGEATVRETPMSRRPAEPGIYQTIRSTHVRTQPDDSATIVDQIGSSVRLNVLGSEGNWLIVRSNKLQATVYIRRDDAMFLPGEKPRESFQEAEARWNKVEADITESLTKWGVSGVTASFREDTAYLEGRVKTDYERFRAEMAAKSIPEVQYVINRIRLNP